MIEVKLFNRWGVQGITVTDPGLKRYVTLKPLIVPRTCGRGTKNPFWKSKKNIVERLMNKLMVPGHKGKVHRVISGHCGGKSTKTYAITEKCFTIIEQKIKKNPVEVFIKALENAAPREEITTIEYGGARYPQAVECSPQRRIDVALRMFVQGAYSKSFRSKKSIENALADEIIAAYNSDNKSNAISKKLELERQADASR